MGHQGSKITKEVKRVYFTKYANKSFFELNNHFKEFISQNTARSHFVNLIKVLIFETFYSSGCV